MVSESVHTAVAAFAAACELVLLSLMIFINGWVTILFVSLSFVIIGALVFVAAFVIQYFKKLRYKVAPLVTVALLVTGMIASLIAEITLIVRSANNAVTEKSILHAAATYAFLPLGIGIAQLLLLFFAPPPRFANIQADAQKKLGTSPPSKESVGQSSVRQSSIEEQSGDVEAAQEGSVEEGGGL